MKKCSLCGEKALEGIEICPECLKKAAVDPKQIKRLRQISNILSITADTDTNIKACMQSITEIAILFKYFCIAYLLIINDI